MTWALAYTANQGVELESTYPYKARDQKCKYDATKVVFKNSGYKNTTKYSEHDLKTAVA